MADPIWNWTARATIEQLKKGNICPLDVLKSLRARVEQINASVNAFPTLCFDRAENASKKLATAPSARGFFAGLPWSIKDSVAVSGVRTTYGSRAFADYVPETSDYVVDTIEKEGGLVFAKSNTPEFEAGANTFNDVFGTTFNPWDVSRSAGGSSGGAAVAVATGMSFLAQGSDFACSVRYPAAFCNVVGLRPTPGVIPQGPSALPHQVLSVIGPIARNVYDIALAMDGLARFDVRDPLSRPLERTSTFVDAVQSAAPPKRAAVSMTLGLAKVDPIISDVFNGAINKLASAGLEVADKHPDLRASDSAFRTLRAYQFAAVYGHVLSEHRDKLKPEVVWNIEEGFKLTTPDLARAENERNKLRHAMIKFLDSYTVLITPTAPVEPFPADQRYINEIDGEKLTTYLDWLILGYAISVCGCPAISIPCGLSKNGLPVGLQIVGKPYGERELLRTAAWCETILGSSLAQPIDPKGV